MGNHNSSIKVTDYTDYQTIPNDNHIHISINEDSTFKFNHFNGIVSFPINTPEKEIVNIITECTKNYNHSGHIFHNGKRSNYDWSKTNLIMVDCDDGLLIKDVQKILDEKNINYIIVPSKSHQVEKYGKTTDRFHVYIPTNSDIYDSQIFYNNIQWFIKLFSADKQASDRARFFGPNPHLTKDKVIIQWNNKFHDPHSVPVVDQQTSQISPPIIRSSNPESNRLFDKKFQIFLKHVKNLHPTLRFSHYNESNGSLNFWRNTKDNNPGLFLLKNSRFIQDKAKDAHYELQWTLEDFMSMEKTDFDATHKKIVDYLTKLQEKNSQDPKHQFTIVKTNEGAGKSRAVNDVIQLGDIYTFETKNRMLEEIPHIERRGKKTRVIWSNGDIIYNTIEANRNKTKDAKREAMRIYNEYQHIYVDKLNKMSISKEQRSQFLNLMDSLFDTVDGGAEKTRSSLSSLLSSLKQEDEQDIIKRGYGLMAFLEDQQSSGNISELEARYILKEYQDQIYAVLSKKYVLLSTTAKFRIMCQSMPAIFDNKTIYQDEFSEDSYSPAEIIEPNDQYYQLKMSIASKLYHEDTGSKIDLPPEEEERIQNIKDKYGVEEWMFTKCWGGIFRNLIEIKKVDWFLYPKNLNIIILTTEDIATFALPFAETIDLSQKMWCPKMTCFYVDGLNKMSNKNLMFQKDDRTILAKSLIKDFLKVDEKYIIGDGIGHSVSNDLFNHKNARGTNKIKEELLKKKKDTNIAIMLTHPHPSKINQYKGIFFLRLREIANERGESVYSFINSSEVDDYILSIILNDNIHQSLGRVLGFRENKYVKNVYLVMNNRLKSKLNLKYVTHKTFTYSSMTRNVSSQKGNVNEYKFLHLLHLLLKHQGPQIKLSDQDPRSIRDIICNMFDGTPTQKKFLMHIIMQAKLFLQRCIDKTRKLLNPYIIPHIQNNLKNVKRYVLLKIQKSKSKVTKNELDSGGFLSFLDGGWVDMGIKQVNSMVRLKKGLAEIGIT